MTKPRRHVDFFALMEALGQPGCPACRLADRAARRFIETLFYEQVTDPQARARLRRSEGFCEEHTAVALQLGDALGSSIIYADVLAAASQSLGSAPSQTCPACHTASEAAQRALNTLLTHFAEEEAQLAYRQSDGLCLPHLRQIIPSRSKSAAAKVLDIERERLARLAAECEEFAAKSDYRRLGEPLGSERNAWQRAARKLGGGFPRNGSQ